MREIRTSKCTLALFACALLQGGGARGDLESASRFDPLAVAAEAQRRRIELVDRLAPAVVCLFDEAERGGGSGVLVDPEGYGLTNYHVVAGMMETRRGLGGLSDGRLYDLEVLGIDPTGDVAMFRLKGRESFPWCPLADSDEVRVGEQVLAMGNPFVLSEDYTPTVTLGIVTGVHRYQWGVGTNLIYSDCIQTDAPINPGNSGGPLFNLEGRIIGINGRISVSTRGRFNVGFAYAITSNQIKRFMPSLRAGLLTEHGTTQATVVDGPDGEVLVHRIKPGGAGDRAGLRIGDRLLALDGIPLTSSNRFASLLGTYPARWPILLHVARGDERLPVPVPLDPLPPRLRRPFEVDAEINLREAERVLSKFHRVVYPGKAVAPPVRWRYTVERTFPGDGNQPDTTETYRVEQAGDGPATMRPVTISGDPQLVRVIRYDDRAASWFNVKSSPAEDSEPTSGGEGEAYLLPLEARMALAAMYMLKRTLPAPIEAIDMTGVRHGGGDRLLRKEAVGQTEAGGAAMEKRPDWRLVEVIEWPVAQHGLARLAFDVETFELVRIVVEDKPSGTQVTLKLSDYRDIGGLHWPGRIETATPTQQYVDRLRDWMLQ